MLSDHRSIKLEFSEETTRESPTIWTVNKYPNNWSQVRNQNETRKYFKWIEINT
jgi:hypothetical protein